MIEYEMATVICFFNKTNERGECEKGELGKAGESKFG